jgi:Arc/MetJ family transcription regulator
MRTTLDLDRDLLERAKEALGSSSFTEAIETALQEAVARTEGTKAWSELRGAESSWESVDDLLEFRRSFGGRPL